MYGATWKSCHYFAPKFPITVCNNLLGHGADLVGFPTQDENQGVSL